MNRQARLLNHVRCIDAAGDPVVEALIGQPPEKSAILLQKLAQSRLVAVAGSFDQFVIDLVGFHVVSATEDRAAKLKWPPQSAFCGNRTANSRIHRADRLLTDSGTIYPGNPGAAPAAGSFSMVVQIFHGRIELCVAPVESGVREIVDHNIRVDTMTLNQPLSFGTVDAVFRSGGDAAIGEPISWC